MPQSQKTTSLIDAVRERAPSAGELFADLSTAPAPRTRKAISRAARAAGVSLSPSSSVNTLNPCLGCPRAKAVKVKPIIPKSAKLIVIGLAPGDKEEKNGQPFQGPSGEMIRGGLSGLGLPEGEVGFANLARCRPEGDDFESKEWQEAERRCTNYLTRDLAQVPDVPLLLMGTRPLVKLTGDPDLTVTAMRGLWVRTESGRPGYAIRHPSGILRTAQESARKALIVQWDADLKRMIDRVLGVEKPRAIDVSIFRTPWEGQDLLRRLSFHPHPWAFDIESYDAKEFPSRKRVSTDPCHEDFRVRGVAVAWGPNKGAYFELMGVEGKQDDVRPLLDLAFTSPAEKWAFNGGFDEEGLTYTDWVTEVTNRRGDGMLDLVALSDGRHSSLRLERWVVDLLGYPQYWNGIDKGRIRDLSLEEVARAAVEDACSTWALCSLLNKRLAKGEYFQWKTWTPR